jgi:hypothetical protein
MGLMDYQVLLTKQNDISPRARVNWIDTDIYASSLDDAKKK